MSLDSDIKLMGCIKLFEGFESEQLRLLAFGSETLVIEDGEDLFLQDAQSDGGYVIVEGRIDLVSGPDDTVVKQFGAGALLGELALITDTKHPATARAKRRTQVLKISRALFRRMLGEYPHLVELLQQRIANSVKEFMDRLSYVSNQMDRADKQFLEEQVAQQQS